MESVAVGNVPTRHRKRSLLANVYLCNVTSVTSIDVYLSTYLQKIVLLLSSADACLCTIFSQEFVYESAKIIKKRKHSNISKKNVILKNVLPPKAAPKGNRGF